MEKKIILTLLVLLVVTGLNASVIVNGVDINKEDIRYCELLARGKWLSKKVTIIVDYGQKTKFLSKSQTIKDSFGKSKKFHSAIDALNFMDKNGWEHVDSYFLTTGKSNVLHFLFKKKE